MERLFGKLKQVISNNNTGSMEEFLDNFYAVLDSLQNDHDHTTAVQFQKVLNATHPPGLTKEKYMQSHAAGLVLRQIRLHSLVSSMHQVEGYCIDSHKGSLTVSTVSCKCLFLKATGLPCRHILAVCHKSNLDLFESGFCLQRWFLTTCCNAQQLLSLQSLDASSHPTVSVATISTASSQPSAVMTLTGSSHWPERNVQQ